MSAHRRAACLPAWLLVLCMLPVWTDAALVRVNCRGIQQLSSSEGRASCAESSVLDDGAERVILGHTRAEVSLPRGRLHASAAGGQIRDLGANGGEAGALLTDRVTVNGDWEGAIAVTIRLCVDYAFAGFGESRILATLKSATGGAAGSQARVALTRRGFGGARLDDLGSRGHFTFTPEGRHAARSTLMLSVTESLQTRDPALRLRVDLAAYALPNLHALESSLTSFGRATAYLVVSLPRGLGLSSESGLLLSGRPPGTADADQGSKQSTVIITSHNNGKANALRSHRGGNRAAARSDCRHQLRLDG